MSSNSTHAQNMINNRPRTPPIPAALRMSDASLFDDDDNDDASASASAIDLKSTHNEHHDATCVICLDAISPGESTLEFPGCSHSMWHAHCVRKWLAVAARCPLCGTSAPCPSSRSNRSPRNILELRSRRNTSYGLTTEPSTNGSSRRINPLSLPWSLSERRANVNNSTPDDSEENSYFNNPSHMNNSVQPPPRGRNRARRRSEISRRRRRRRQSFNSVTSSAQENEWVLLERRISLVSRRRRPHVGRTLAQSLSMIWR